MLCAWAWDLVIISSSCSDCTVKHRCVDSCLQLQAYIHWHSSYMAVINLCNTNFIIAEIRENVLMCKSTCMLASWIFWSRSTQDGNRIIYNFICIISNTAVFCTSSNAACLSSHSITRLFMFVQSSLHLQPKETSLSILCRYNYWL